MFRRSGFGIAAVAVLALSAGAWQAWAAAKASGPMMGHMVYFSLNDPTPENCKALVDACHKYLTGHEGVVFYAAGTRAEDAAREVNDKDFDVALQVVFDGKDAHDIYQTHPRHLEFIKVAQPLLSKVRVFDAYVTDPGSSK